MAAVSPTITSSSCYQSLPSCVSGLSMVPLFPSPPASFTSITTIRPASAADTLPPFQSLHVQALSPCPSSPDQSTLSALASYIVKKLPELAEKARILEREEKELDRRIRSLEDNVDKLAGGRKVESDLGGGESPSISGRGKKRGADALHSDGKGASVRFSHPVLIDEDIQVPSGNADMFLRHTISLRSRRKGRVFLGKEADAIVEGNVKRRRLD